MDDKGGLADSQCPRLLVGIALLPSKVGWASARRAHRASLGGAIAGAVGCSIVPHCERHTPSTSIACL